MANITAQMHYLFLLFLLVHHCVGPPTGEKKKEGDASKESENSEKKEGSIDDFGLEYNRYLTEVVNALESDPEFRKKLETAQEADFRNGKVAAELEYVNHHVRTKLDELKRVELQRLRDLVRQSEEIDNFEVNPDHVNPSHVDHTNPHTFESADLHKLITKVRQDLAEADRKRREEFKEYELQKKFEQEQKVKSMDEEHKKQYLHELEEQKKKHQKHEPLHHPGSRAQLEEVWEKEDQMKDQKFNPKTFFLMHDINGDGYWDEDEVKALFVKELDKLYQAGVPEDDMREREEEMERMREHVFKESDTNGDRLISYEEFYEQTKKQEFNRDEGWETLDSQPQYTQEEYEEFERRRQQEIQRLIDQGMIRPYAPGMMPPPGYAPHPGQFQQQYVPHPGAVDPNHIQAQQYGQNAGYHQGVPPQHPQGMPQHPQYSQGLPQHPQGVPQHPQAINQHPQGVNQHPQGVNQHPQGVNQHPQGVNQHPQGVNQHPQGVPKQSQGHPQGVPPQVQYAQQGQAYNPQGQAYNPQGQAYNPQGQTYNPQGQAYNPQGQAYNPQGQQYGGHYSNQALPQANQPQINNIQPPASNSNRGVPQNQAPPQPNAIPVDHKQASQYGKQLSDHPVPGNQGAGQGQPNQNTHQNFQDPSQGVPSTNQQPNQEKPSVNQQLPSSNLGSNQQYNPPPQAQSAQQQQGTYGSQPVQQPASFQEAKAEHMKQIHS